MERCEEGEGHHPEDEDDVGAAHRRVERDAVLHVLLDREHRNVDDDVRKPGQERCHLRPPVQHDGERVYDAQRPKTRHPRHHNRGEDQNQRRVRPQNLEAREWVCHLPIKLEPCRLCVRLSERKDRNRNESDRHARECPEHPRVIRHVVVRQKHARHHPQHVSDGNRHKHGAHVRLSITLRSGDVRHHRKRHRVGRRGERHEEPRGERHLEGDQVGRHAKEEHRCGDENEPAHQNWLAPARITESANRRQQKHLYQI
mmetsp:Transcript_24788/g.81081  ORF Transcript_24788/g.81081 Transcript_24788/m.81081 type:complete len:257 (-) Transcript_24788:296-1066(-)